MQRAAETQKNIEGKGTTASLMAEKFPCDLCFKVFDNADEFVIHCQKDKHHKELIQQYTDESYDQLFEELEL